MSAQSAEVRAEILGSPATIREMTRSEVLDLTLAVMKSTAPSDGPTSVLAENTRLFGQQGVFDSLGLVTLITEVEAQVNDRAGAAITIANERAMSSKRSPFRTVGTLVDYVMELLVSPAPEDLQCRTGPSQS